MVESTEGQLMKLMNGEALDEAHVDLLLPDQENYVPITKRTVCYIVCGLLFNEHGEVLMMQEAKTSCYGTWYLPAGRMEPNETIQEGTKREVLEETGIEFEPTTLLAVETYSGFWYRFTMTGKITGGRLKDYEHRDKESLQARWCTVEQIQSHKKGFPIRCDDIFPLIDLGVQYQKSEIQHPSLQPAIIAHKKLLVRLVCLHKSPDGDLCLLQSKLPRPHLPIGVISPDDKKIDAAIIRLLFVAFGRNQLKELASSCLGVLSVEYNGKPAEIHDGFCITLVLDLKHQVPDSPLIIKDVKHFEWQSVQNSELKAQIETRVQERRFVRFLH